METVPQLHDGAIGGLRHLGHVLLDGPGTAEDASRSPGQMYAGLHGSVTFEGTTRGAGEPVTAICRTVKWYHE
jgi:hypothetical protein